MKTLRLCILLLCSLVAVAALSEERGGGDKKKKEEAKETKLTADGPYILYNADGSARVISVTKKGRIEERTYPQLPAGFGFDVVSHDGKHRFRVRLHPVERPQWKFEQPEKLFVMSDPHGDFDCVVSLLRGNGVIDKKYHWNYGNNRLVVIGDVFDRGNDVLPIFWLLYQLEQEAAEAGGAVDFLLGNHEPLVLMNDLRYTKPKYKQLADTLGVDYPYLFSPSTELGRWLCTRNTMQVVGRNLFVHAGLGKDFLEQNLDIPTVNEQMSLGLYKRKAERQQVSPLVYFLFSSEGPIWYRGLVREEEKYHPLDSDTLNLLLQKYEADRIIVGHTIFDDISFFYDGRVVDVNVNNARNREEKLGRAILIENGVLHVVGDEGIIR